MQASFFPDPFWPWQDLSGPQANEDIVKVGPVEILRAPLTHSVTVHLVLMPFCLPYNVEKMD